MGHKALTEGDEVKIGGSPKSPHWGKPCHRSRPVNDLDANEVLNLISNTFQNWSTVRKNHNFYELESLNSNIQSLRAETTLFLHFSMPYPRYKMFCSLLYQVGLQFVLLTLQRTYDSRILMLHHSNQYFSFTV